MIPGRDHNGRLYSSLSAMARAYGISLFTLSYRLDKGMSVKDALTKPVAKQGDCRKCRDHLGRIYNSFNERARAYGIGPMIIKWRLKHKWSLEHALTTPVCKQKKFIIERQLL